MKATIEKIISAKICPYCFKAPVFVSSEEVYGKDYGMIYLCRACQAWVGVHKGTADPLGRLANKELREYKKLAHATFDPLWKKKQKKGFSKTQARNAAYKWLSKMMGLPARLTHIGMFDADQCRAVIEICKRYYK